MADDWVGWHHGYDDPASHLGRRLVVVQQRIREAVDRMPGGPIRVVSMCAGQGRDLVGALAEHPRRHDIDGRLVELDTDNVERARAAIQAADLPRLEVVAGDAGTTDVYIGTVPADLVLACGVFGNITDDDIAHTVRTLPQLCAPGATVIWTRHRLDPDVTPTIRGWFEAAGFEELHFDAPADDFFTVGAHRLHARPRPVQPSTRLFDFVGLRELRG